MIGHVQTDVVGMPKDHGRTALYHEDANTAAGLPRCTGWQTMLMARMGTSPRGRRYPNLHRLCAMGGRNASENFYPVGSCAVCSRISIDSAVAKRPMRHLTGATPSEP